MRRLSVPRRLTVGRWWSDTQGGGAAAARSRGFVPAARAEGSGRGPGEGCVGGVPLSNGKVDRRVSASMLSGAEPA